MHDVDEYLQVMAANTTLKEWLFQHGPQIRGGVKIEQHIWPLTKYSNQSSPIWMDSTIRDARLYGLRHKNFVRPSQVHYHSVHEISGGDDQRYQADASRDLRFVHFRDGIKYTPKQDTSLYDKYRELVVEGIKNMN